MLTMLTFTVFAASAGDVLITTGELAEFEHAIVVDARSHDAFEAAHIAGARSLPTTKFSSDRDGVTNMLRPPNEITAILATAGVGPELPVVVYSGMKDGKDLHEATRLFWILEYMGYPRVYVLDGGLTKWMKEGRPTETGPVVPEPITGLVLTPDTSKLATKDEVAAASKSGARQLADFRSAGDFAGLSRSPAVVRGGHIPTACNLPSDAALNDDFTFKDPETLKVLAAEQGLRGDAPVTAYCNTGRAATVGYFMLRRLGFEDVSMYDGSMAEWTRDESAEVVEGDDR